MSKYLCKVAKVYQLTGRVVVVSDTQYEDFDTRVWRHGSVVELRRPDGSSIRTQTWYETGSPSDTGRPMTFSVDKSLSKSDVPPGTEVWLIRQSDSRVEQVMQRAQDRPGKAKTMK